MLCHGSCGCGDPCGCWEISCFHSHDGIILVPSFFFLDFSLTLSCKALIFVFRLLGFGFSALALSCKALIFCILGFRFYAFVFSASMVHMKSWCIATFKFLQARFCFCYQFVCLFFYSLLLFSQTHSFPLQRLAAYGALNPLRINLIMFLCIGCYW